MSMDSPTLARSFLLRRAVTFVRAPICESTSKSQSVPVSPHLSPGAGHQDALMIFPPAHKDGLESPGWWTP